MLLACWPPYVAPPGYPHARAAAAAAAARQLLHSKQQQQGQNSSLPAYVLGAEAVPYT